MMQNLRKFAAVVLVLSISLKVDAQDSYGLRVANYITTYKELAIQEQKRSGIPAAITLAQGIHETSAGASELATEANNHFGIKCKKEWTGETFAHTDDAPNECFRKYPKAYDSYIDHSDYLKNSPRYNSLFQLSITDYASWATGLKRCGYATNPRYAKVLIKLIEDYHLQDYTYAALEDNANPLKITEQPKKQLAEKGREVIPETDAPSPAIQTPPAPGKKSNIKVDAELPETGAIDIKNSAKPEYGQLVRVNGLKAFYARKGTSLLNEALKYNVRYIRLLEINELPDAPLEADMFIYLEKKHTKGNTALHVTKPGETLLQAAQYEGMQLKYLKYYNKLANNEEPVAGSLLYLQEMADQKPETEQKVLTASASRSSGAFAGDRPRAIPQGATRMKAGYISKAEIENGPKENSIEVARPVEKKKLPPPPVEAREPKEEITAVVPVTTPVQQAQTKGEESTPVPEIIARENKEVPAAVTIEERIAPVTMAPEEPAEVATIEKKEVQPVEASEIVKKHAPITQAEKEEETAQVARVDAPSSQTVPVAAFTAPQENKPAISPEVKDAEPQAPEIILAAAPQQETPVLPLANAEEAPIVKETVPAVVAADETVIPAPVVEASPVSEPKDEFDRLKARLDKVVYASDNIGTKKQAATEVPKEQPKPKPQAGSGKSSASGFVGLYTVKKGDNAFSIAKKNHITMKQLMEWNDLDFKEIKVGQQLRVK